MRQKHKVRAILLALSVSATTGQGDEAGPCITVGGNKAGQPCVFPFTNNGVTYSGCTVDDDPDNKLWCSVATDDAGNHLKGSWGHCPREGCPLDQQECILHSGDQGACTPLALCGAGFFPTQEDVEACSSQDGLTVVCCPRQLESSGTLAFAAPTFASGVPNENTPENVTLEEIELRFDTRTPVLAAAAPSTPSTSIVFEEVQAEEEQEAADADVQQTPEAFHLRFNRPRKAALEVDEAATLLLDVTNEIQSDKNLTAEEAGFGLRAFDFTVSSSIGSVCPWSKRLIRCDASSVDSVDSKYRRADGSCNNLKETNYGRSTTPFQRIIDKPSYAAGSLQAPRKSTVETRRGSNVFWDLPLARRISLKIAEKVTIPRPQDDAEPAALDRLHTVLVMQMGQFIDHDITHTPNYGQTCCNPDGTFPDSYDPHRCYPLRLPRDDPFWSAKGKSCMNMARSLSAPTTKCSLQFREQMNQITHWLDASNIYGSDEHETKLLRLFRNGQLKVTRQEGSRYGSLPTCSENFRPHGGRDRDIAEACEECSGQNSGPDCFFAGDVRVNEQLNLIVMHTIWLREHNRIATFLAANNPGWDDERVFQETRRIVIAEYQHIIYQEWLPIILGPTYMTKFGMWPLSIGYSKAYLDSFDPRVTNEFATAAFRFGHSLIPNSFEGIQNPNGRQRALGTTGRRFRILLKELFFKPGKVRSDPNMIDELTEGMLRQTGHKWDQKFVDDIQNHLFETTGDGGLDLIALNIQRGRDHGLPGYNAYREICAVGKASDWSDFEDFIPPRYVEKLRATYKSVDDVDLFVGGFLEEPHQDSILGPVFKCIIGDTFARLKLGDRFFYDLDNEGLNMSPDARNTLRFTRGQLREIRKVSMARILCDNTEQLAEIQPQVFQKIGSSVANILRPCNSRDIPKLNLNEFAQREPSTGEPL